MNWYLEVLSKYAVFDGRARRSEYWFFVLFNILIYVALTVVGVVFGFVADALAGLVTIVTGLYGLAVLIPGLAVSIRRLHDTGRSGWWVLVGLVPVIGGIILLVLMALDSQPGENEYGPNPKEA